MIKVGFQHYSLPVLKQNTDGKHFVAAAGAAVPRGSEDLPTMLLSQGSLFWEAALILPAPEEETDDCCNYDVKEKTHGTGLRTAESFGDTSLRTLY